MKNITQKQLEANRKNSLLGGVKTEEGKKVSKMNAIKHGLLSSQVLIEGEDSTEFMLVEKNLQNQLCPKNQIEALLVDRIIAGFWRLKRLLKIESNLMILQSCNTLNQSSFYDENGQEIKKVSDMLDNSLLERLMRYENNIDRGIFKALHELQILQAVYLGKGAVAINIGLDDIK